MARSVARIGFVQACLMAGLVLVLARAGQLQLVRGAELRDSAMAHRTVRDTLEARRGAIYDRFGVALAVTQEFYHLGVAPNEVKEPQQLASALARVVHVPAEKLRRRMRTEKYLYFHGPYTATEIDPLRKFKGVHPEGSYRRAYPSRSLAAPVIGRLDADSGKGGSGLERAMDELLTGVPGEAVFLRDRLGRRFESPSRRLRDPVPGNDVWLTLDYQLQDIAERALEDAIQELDAEGGDIVVLDPRSGEIIAIASRQAGWGEQTARPTAFTDPFEPGSTAKLFTAAALLRLAKVDTTDLVHGENGKWAMPIGSSGRVRVLSDVHKVDHAINLADAIKFSSNIAMAKFSQRLTVEEQYTTMRDFGFGSPTGVEFPSESRGQLAAPEQWRADYSRASVAMGYEFGVTALQLASAYAAIANDGVLLTPTLVREVRAHDGSLVYRHQPEPVRRVVSSEVARELVRYLRLVTGEGGTAAAVRLANYELAGKTGTARWYRNGRYDGYRASFAALFPADQPQLVIVVKLDNPRKGSYYGGATAAPITKQMLERAIASRVVALDRTRLARAEPVPLSAPARQPAPEVPVVRVGWPYRERRDSAARAPLPVPDVAGKGVRAAVHSLHMAGFRVVAHGTGTVLRSAPTAGAEAAPGSTVHVWTTD